MRVDDYGIFVDAEVTFRADVTMSDPVLHLGDTHDTAWLWPMDGRDHEGEDLDPVTVPAGTAVEVSGALRPSCDAEEVKTMYFTIAVSEDEAPPRIHEYPAANQVVMPPAVRQWCAKGPAVTAGMERLEPDGDAEIGVYVINPGPNSVTVTIPAYTDEHVSWTGATVEAPPGEKTRLEIHGTDVGCEPGEIASWADGRLLLDGEPYKVRMDDAWC